jgi:hypothetical protein
MSTKNKILHKPFLVRVDCDTRTYAQYHGRQRLVAAVSTINLDDMEVELFRTNPKALLGEEPEDDGDSVA